MNSQKSAERKTRFMGSNKVVGIFVIISVCLPYLIAFSSSGFTMGAMLWTFIVRPWGVSLDFQNPSYWFGTGLIMIGIPQLAFSYFMYRFYQKKTTKKRLIHVGLIGMVPVFFWGFMNALPRLWDPFWPGSFNMLPIPIILPIAYLFLRRYSPIPVDEEEADSWLESK